MKVLVWNLELFGMRFQEDEYLRNLRNIFVAAIVLDNLADVLIVQEATENCAQELAFTCGVLMSLSPAGTIWSYDWIKGATRVDLEQGARPSFADLRYSQAAHNEGYAVIWKGNSLSPIAGAASAGQNCLRHTPAANKYIDIIYDGALLEYRLANVPLPPNALDIFYRDFDILYALYFPQRQVAGGIDVEYDLRDRRVPNYNSALSASVETRRPCYVDLNVQGVDVPCVVYHAPNGSPAHIWGAQVALASAPLRFSRAAFAGDLNLNSGTKQRDFRRWAVFGYPNFSWSTINLDGSSARTMISPVTFRRDGFRVGADIRHSTRDFGFVRQPAAGGATEVIDPTRTCLIAPGANARRVLEKLSREPGRDQRLGIIPGINTTVVTLGIVEYSLLDVLKLGFNGRLPLRDMGRDVADYETFAAIIYKELISDHLPILLTVT